MYIISPTTMNTMVLLFFYNTIRERTQVFEVWYVLLVDFNMTWLNRAPIVLWCFSWNVLCFSSDNKHIYPTCNCGILFLVFEYVNVLFIIWKNGKGFLAKNEL